MYRLSITQVYIHVFLVRGGNQRGGPLSNDQWWVPNQPAQRLTSRGELRPNYQRKAIHDWPPITIAVS
jgi:hypothetical protein